MPSKSPSTPKDLKIRRLPAKGDEIWIRATVTGVRPIKPRDAAQTYDMVSLQIPGAKTPVTIPADYLDPDPDA